MDEQKSHYSPNADQEMNVGECSSEGEGEGEDEGEGDDEEELDEEIDFIGEEDSEEAIDEEDETIDSVSLSSENFNGFKELEFPLDESSSQDVSENIEKTSNDLDTSLQSKTIVTSVISISGGETKFSVKLKRCKGPEKLCCLCNLGEQSQLGQGKLHKIKKPESFVEEQLPEEEKVRSVDVPKAKEVVTGKHKKTTSRHNLSLHEPVDEHSMIGFATKVNLSSLFDEAGYLYIHSNCAFFSRQITCNDNSEFENVIACVSKSLTRICSHCNRYGASVTCSFNNCDKTYHYPCSAASAGFQHLKTHSFICTTHIDHIPLLPTFNEVSCHMCFSLGDVSNLVMCSICGNHYHGICLGRALLPGVRTGWQCSECRSCQVCHASDNSSKIMLCEVCDKAYHSACLRPAVTSIPKFGWKCQYCRICSDCGSRTPGSGFSSRWHRHFTVCDSCYQQRNKGFFCPLCHRAYRTGSSKEMAQCTSCKKFVHRTCDPEADPVAYHKKIETFPDYQYVCPTCKNMHQFGKITLKRKESFEDSSVDMNMNTSHESLTSDDMEIDSTVEKDDYKFSGGIGLGKGKPFTARKKMAFTTVRGFKSKYNGKAALCPPLYQKKNQKIVDFGKKRYTKTKMRGVFGVPGAGLQGPVTDSQIKSDRECDEKKILLCSTSDEFVLSQDICVKCSALGTDQEGCLIACVQCGQCYHPFCADSNKVTKITKTMLQRGWKCIKCAVCEGCGKCDNESVLILCDDCNIAYHTYCVEPKLDSVPEGSWKCKWCAHCLTCGANEPGLNSVWLKNYTECGPCASRVRCPSCHLLYGEGDLIIKCENCERWLHGVCDQIKSESDAEKCAIEGYSCLLCRPKDIQPPHLLIPPKTPPVSNTTKLKIRPISPIKVSESSNKDEAEHFVDGTYLSENGLSHLTTLLNRIDTNVFSLRKKKRANNSEQGEQGILDSIESVIAGGESPSSSSAIVYKEGMVMEPREDGKPPEAPEGFNISTNGSGIMILKKKRIRKIGVGGFNARMRTGKKDRAEDEETNFYNEDASSSRSVMSSSDEKPRKKNRYRKPKSKYAESYPSYIQDAFFGRELLDTSKVATKNIESSDSDSSEALPSRKITSAETVTLSSDELKIMEQVNAKREKMEEEARKKEQEALKLASMKIKVENEERVEKVDELMENENETFKDILNMSGNFLDSIMNEDSLRPKTNSTMMNEINLRTGTDVGNYSSNNTKDEFTDILGPNFNLESMVHESGLPNMDGKDVEDIFKDVLTDDTPNSRDSILPQTNVNTVSSSTFPMNQPNMNVHPPMVNTMQSDVISQTPNATISPSHSVIQSNMNIPSNRAAPLTPSQVLPSPQNIPSPATYPATSPYHSEYSNSPSQFSPAFSEPPSPWVQEDTTPTEGASVIIPSTSANQRNSQKMEVDETLGDKATISSVLYANTEHPELKTEFPVWSDRCKQILKKWRALPTEKKQPYLNQARENRTNMTRVRKSSKISKDENTTESSSSNLEAESSNNNASNSQLISNLANPETMSKCHEDLLHPLLSVLSAEGISLDSNDQTLQSSSSLQPSSSPDNQNIISTPSSALSSFTTSERLINEMDSTSSPVSILNSSNHSNDTDGTISQQTVTTTIPSHPSTIQYIPIIQTPISQSDSALNVRTVHLISTTVPNQSTATQIENTTRASTIRYQYVPAIQHNRNTIHYPPNNVQIIHSGSSIITNSNSLITAALQSVPRSDTISGSNKFLQLIPSSVSQNQIARNIQTMSLTPDEQCETRTESDQNIRVLTPSEIMKTLPSLGQESFGVNSNTEQEKIVSMQKMKESEQEKNWKQMQALRQQQMHDPRLQTLQRIQQQLPPQHPQNQLRQIAGSGAENPNVLFANSPVADNRAQLQIVTSQDGMPSPLTSPGRPPQRFPSSVTKLPPPSPQVNQQYQRVQNQDVFTPPSTPRPQFYSTSQNSALQTNNSIRQRAAENEVYSAVNSNPEMNRQLRELLQKQQMESAQTEQQPSQTRVWVQDSSNQQVMSESGVIQNEPMNMPSSPNVQSQMFDSSQNVNTMSRTFRSPLPPRSQRLPFQVAQQILIKQRMPQQVMDPRFRLLIQQQQQHQLLQQQRQQQLQQQQQHQHQQQQLQQQQFQQQMQAQQSPQHMQITNPNQVTPPPASSAQPKSSSLHEAQLSEQAQNILTGNVRLDESNIPGGEATSSNKPADSNLPNIRNDTQNEGLPESVTADLDELEKDGVVTGNISEIFGDLMEDDELLAEIGTGFNILEYADPELDDLTNGEKSNILYDFVNGASDSNKPKDDGKPDGKNDSKEPASTDEEMKLSTNETKDIQMQIEQVENSFNENNNLPDRAQQQHMLQLQRTKVRNPNSPSPSGNQLMQHPSPTNSHVSVQSHSSPMTPRPPSTVTASTRSPLPAPSTPHSQDLMAQSPITGDMPTQLPVITPPPPPPPPYPGPPPPYPSQLKQQFPQQVHHMGGSPAPNVVTVPGGTMGMKLVQHGQIPPGMSQLQKRPLLLQEQPLLLEDLLEQEKREQEKQTGSSICGALPPLSDADFERLRVDVMNHGSMQKLLAPPSQNLQSTMMPSSTSTVQGNVKVKTDGNVYEVPQQQMWSQSPIANNIQSNNVSSIQVSSNPRPELVQRIPVFNAPKLQVPQEPPENIVTEQDQRMQQAYELWLDQQNSILTQQLKHYEGEIAKLRKTKKSLNSKQRILKKQGNELTERDTAELQKVTGELSALQKYLDSSRKMSKQHATVIQEYKNKHPNSAYASSNIGSPSSTQNTPVPVNVVSSANSAIGENPTNVMVTSTHHKLPVVVASTLNRTNPTNIITQTQSNEMQYTPGSNQQETSSANVQSPTMVSPQVRPTFRAQENIVRYPGGASVRFLQSVRQQKPNVMTFQVPNDGVRQTGMYQNVRGTFKTQPFIVSAVSSPSSPSISTVTSNMSPIFQNTTGQQNVPDQQQMLIQRQQFAQRPVMLQHTVDVNALTARQKRIFQQRQNLISQIQSIQLQMNTPNLAPQTKQTLLQQKDALIRQVKELQQQIELTPQLKQQFLAAQRQQMLFQQQQQQQQKQNTGMNQMNQVLVTSQQASMQQKHMSPPNSMNQQLNQLLSHSPETNQHQYNQPMNSPIQPQSPQQFSHPHSNSSAPPHSPMYQSQPAPSPTGDANYSYMHSGPPSVQSHYNQPASPMPSQSPRHVSQFVHPSSSPAHPHSPYTSHESDNTGGGGGNTMSYTNAIPIPEEFRRLGIKPGLLGGSPAWVRTKKTKILAHEFEKYGIKGGLLGGTPTWNEKPEGNGVEKVDNAEKNTDVEDIEMKACTSKSPTSATSSQFYTMEEDIDSSDSPVFFPLPGKIMKIKSPSAESPNDFENVEFQGCETPKTLDDSIELPVYKDVPLIEGCKSEEMNASDDSMELPMYKDVRLIEGCKSEESSLCFPTTIEDNEISLPLDMDTNELHLALDSGDDRNDDLLDSCLVTSDLLVLNVNEDQEIVEETKHTPDTISSTPLRTTSVVQTTTTISTTSINNLAKEKPTSCEESNIINHSVISTHAFHSYAKIVENDNSQDSVEMKEEPEPEPEPEQEPEPDVQPEAEIQPRNEPETDSKVNEESENTEMMAEPKEELQEPKEEVSSASPETTNSITVPVVTTIPTRTTSVLQMTATALQTSSSKEITDTNAERSPPIYDDFHSYVKKLPKSNGDNIAKDDTFEKDKQLFDETLMKIKTENMTVEDQEGDQTIDEKKETGNNTSTNTTKSPPAITTTTTAQYFTTSSVITKDTKLVSVAHSTSHNQPKECTSTVQSQPQQVIGNMFPPRMRPSDDSQNVLLKKLLQNSGSCSFTHSTMTQHVAKPPPSPSYKSPPTNTTAETPASTTTTETVIAQVSEPSSITEPRVQSAPVPTSVPTTVIKQEIGVPSTSTRKESTTIVPPTQTATPTSSTMSPMHIDIKKEIAPEELASPQSKTADVPDTPNSVSGDSSTGSILDAQDLKKLKRRQYQAKRRQSQSKDNAAIPKKRNRRVSRVDEDYDTFVDGLMNRIRQLPRIDITEPLLIHNYAACLPYGAGDGTKINLKTWTNGELTGTFGSLRVPKHNDYYNAEPFGDEEPIPQPAVSPPTNDFYNVELPPLNLEADYEERRLELARLDRELDTPDSVISSSSPECIIPHTPSRFAGLRLIDENGSGVDSEEDEKLLKRISPVIPLVVPLALRPRVQYHQNDSFTQDKENYGKSTPFSLKSRNLPGIPLKDKANLSVTLTLSSQAALDIVGVLKNLATVLNIPPPVSYKICDRIPTPNKINAFGNKFNDDVDRVELDKYLDGSVKRCQHCKTFINDYTSVKKKASEVPFVVQDGVSEDLLFCSTSCYLQMILLVPPVISEQKVSSSDDHVSESSPRKKMRLERSNDTDVSEVSQVFKVTDANSGKDISYVEKTSLTPESTTKNEHADDKKQLKGVRYRTWSIDSIPSPVQKYKTPTEKEITETLFRMNITVMPNKMPDDMRSCIFCQQSGDGVANGPSRLLNYDVDKWAHLNCSLWSDGVYETQNGALMNVDTALKQGLDVICTYCKRNGATLKCFKLRCSKVYHLSCAMKSGCCFLENKSVFCEEHLSKAEINRVLTTLAVYRRVYIDRDENRQIASVIKHAELTHLMRIGSLVFLNVGSLLPHQLQEFHTPNFIYPVGYKVIRFYWSMRIFNKRCQYVCSIHDVAGRPEFRVLVQEPGQDDLELRGSSPNAVWTRILEPLANLRKMNNSVQLFPCYVTGEYLFGLTEPAIVRILENLPGIETLSDYTFKFGRDPLLELPLAVNPSGCARCEPRVRGPPLKRTHTQRTSSVMPRPVLTSSPIFSGDLSCPYSKHFVHSKSSQYKKMKQEWRNHVYLARSKIQGLGLYAARDIDKHTMVIEYIGEIIRSQLSDFREKQYEAKNRGVYMFRLDENRVVDATISGGLARYINHSCNPNCITEKVEVDREYRIIIFSKRRIVRGEELSYDYQFDIEDDMHKIPCLCGASNCRKWMN